MISTLLASFRIAVAVVCVGLSLILGAQWFGLIPDTTAMLVRARGTQCEAIAVNSAAMVRLQKWHELEAILASIVSRDDALLSAGVRTNSGQLRVQTDKHALYWQAARENTEQVETPEDAELPAVDPVQVPIQLHRQPWGQIEFCYRPLPAGSSILQQPLAKLIGFFAIGGLCVYTFLAARMMGLLNGTQVVPDRVRNALDTLSEGLLVLDEDEQIVLANQAFSETVAIDAHELAGRKATELDWIADEGTETPNYPWTREIAQREPLSDQKLSYQLADGRRRIFSINSTPLSATGGGRRGMLATFRDITHIEEHRAELESMLAMLKSSRDEISQKNRELEILATRDPLTNCLNRRSFFERFDRIWQTAGEQSLTLSCIMIDNDHFKSVNDTYGHHVGDEVLRQVSATLREHHQGDDLVCRFGGEEFCIVLPGRDLQQAQQAAEQLRIAIEALRFESPAELRTTASIGVASITQGAATPQDIINQADACLYIAKRQGRNQVVVYQPGFEEAAREPEPIPRTAADLELLSTTTELLATCQASVAAPVPPGPEIKMGSTQKP